MIHTRKWLLQSCLLAGWLLLLLAPGAGRAQNASAPNLNCVSNQPNGDVLLSWSPWNNGCTFVSYDIYCSFAGLNGPYGMIASINNPGTLQYLDVGANGNVNNIYYYLVANYNCPGPVAVNSDTVSNHGLLDSLISYVTVTGVGSQIFWYPSPSPEAVGYVIYHQVGNLFIPLDTVYGVNSYYDIRYNADSSSQGFTVAAIDSCGNIGPIYTPAHQTVFLQIQVSPCTGKLTLVWNAYQHWPAGVKQYEIWVDKNSGGDTKVDSTTSTSYSYSGFNSGDFLSIHIEAIANSGQDSWSNVIQLTPHIVQAVKDFYLRDVTVSAPQQTTVSYSMLPGAAVYSLDLLRSEDGQHFSKIADIPVPASFNGIQQVVDNTPETDYKSYFYRIQSSDSCQNTDSSGRGQSILLSGFSFAGNLKNTLSWNDYSMDHGQVLGYNLYRNRPVTHTFITYLPFGINNYEEDVSGLIDSSGRICYTVEAVCATQFPDGTADTVHSNSNELCLEQIVRLWVPNAFKPDGINRIFRPVAYYTENKTYSFEVFNRWGGLIFETHQFSQGWDGTFEGKDCEEGVYAYHIYVVDKEGRRTERDGTVLLLR